MQRCHITTSLVVAARMQSFVPIMITTASHVLLFNSASCAVSQYDRYGTANRFFHFAGRRTSRALAAPRLPRCKGIEMRGHMDMEMDIDMRLCLGG